MLERAELDGGGVLVVVDGVFSMEGDIAPLPEIVDLCERHGARLMVDEAHAVGVLGERGTGSCELFGLEDRVDLRMGTFSKSLRRAAASVGPADVIEYLRIAARAFVFTAAAVPAAVGAALEAVKICRREGGPCTRSCCKTPHIARGPDRSRPPGRRAHKAPGRHRGDHAGRPVVVGGGLAGGDAVEGAVRRRGLHQRRAASRRPAGRGAAEDELGGDTSASTSTARSRSSPRRSSSSRTAPALTSVNPPAADAGASSRHCRLFESRASGSRARGRNSFFYPLVREFRLVHPCTRRTT